MTQPRPSLNQLTLTVTERCNHDCDYCYVDRTAGRTMSLDVAERAVALLLEHAPAGEPVTVSFFGGEPLLVPELLEDIARRTLALAGGDREVRFALTTNGTAVDDRGLAFLREQGVRLAVSHDGEGQSGRPLADGRDSGPDLHRTLPWLLGLPGSPLARLTVTPDNVDRLAASVRGLHRAGFARLLYLPAVEADWTPRALQAWSAQQQRLATWLVGLHNAGQPAPSLPSWRGVAQLLSGRASRQHCGAGVSQLTVGPDGRIYPCYRSVYDPRGDALVLGDVWSGLQAPRGAADWHRLDPDHPRPEDGDCQRCEARDGCGFFCPALGHLLCGDPAVVPAAACELTRRQVAACRHRAEPASPLPRRRPRKRVLAAALAAALLGGGAACDRNTVGGPGGDAGDTTDGTIGPGVCPVGSDARVDDGSIPDGQVVDAALYDATIGPGLCPVEVDAGQHGDSGVQEDAHIGPGLCPFQPDSGVFPGIC